MDFQITTTGQDLDMSWDAADSVLNNVILSLMVPRGGFFAAPEFGSRLHLLTRMKATERTRALAIGYVREALAWLITAGRLTSVDVAAEFAGSRLHLAVTAWQADGRELAYEIFVEVV